MKSPLSFALLLAVCLPEVASAHLVSTRFGELYSGIIHPLTTLQHVVPWIGLGLLGGLLGNTTGKWALLAFPLAVGAGTVAGSVLPETGAVSYAILASFVVIGLLAALALRLSRPFFIGLAVLVGISHGAANGTSDLAGWPLFLYVCGVTLAAYLLIAISTGIAVTVARQANWGPIAVRAAGSWIVAVGIVFSSYTLMQG